MSDADISPPPYSEEWLRQRGAKFDPRTGKKVSPAPIVSDDDSLRRRGDSGEDKPPKENEELGNSPSGEDDNGHKDPIGPSVGPNGKEPTDDRSKDKIPVDPPRKSRRLPLIIGFALAIAAVIAAEQYIVPMLTHSSRTTKVKQAVTSSSTNQVPENSTTRTVTSPPPKVPVVPIAKPNNAIPKLSPNVHEEILTPSLPTSTPPAQVAPVQAAPVQAAPPANKIIKPNVVPETFPAPVKHHGENNAQYEQQHLNQLMSPLG